MQAIIIALDVQHKNKPSKPTDKGCSADIDKDDKIEIYEYESEIAAEYATYIRQGLEDAGFVVFDGFSGEYADRNHQADTLGASIYLACHINAGGGDYAAVEITNDAGQVTRNVAAKIAQGWQAVLPVRRAIVNQLASGDRGHVCIGAVRCPALILEPLFVDGARHQAALTADRAGLLRCVAGSVVKAICGAFPTGP